MACHCMRHAVCGACLFGPLPAVRVDGVLLFPGGASRLATDDENRRMDAGERVFVDPRSATRTRLVGEERACVCHTPPLPLHAHA